MNYKSFDSLSEDIKRKLFKIHKGDYDLVVGIPRSGMIPAYMIGLYLNINVTDFSSFIDNRPVKKGITRSVRKEISTAHEAKKILIVDDSIMSGESMRDSVRKIPKDLFERVTTLAVYSDRPKRDDVDIFLEYLPAPRVFEWNIFHRNLLGRACVDIDGVLCVDPSEEQNDDGAQYRNFLLNAAPLILPTFRIHSLVTSRLEKYRPETEEWLRNHGIEYENLIMLDLPSKQERQRLGAHATHKAGYFKRSKELDIFIESDGQQAQKIMESTGKPVYCVDENRMYVPGVFMQSVKSPRSVAKRLKCWLSPFLPEVIKNLLKTLYRKLTGL